MDENNDMSVLQQEINEAILPLVSEVKALRVELQSLRDASRNPHLTIRECADELNISQRTVFRRIDEGRFEAKKIGGKRFIIRSSI